jgi:hypothetical protein
MTIDEVGAILDVFEVMYPQFYKGADDNKKALALKGWYMQLKEYPSKLVTESVNALISTSKYPPTVSEVKEKILMLTRPPDMTEAEAWNLVYNAIKSANYRSQENFNNLPPMLQRLVGGPSQLREWAQMETKPLEVASSNFMRSYTARVKQEKEYQILPESNKRLINGLSMSMLESGEIHADD